MNFEAKRDDGTPIEVEFSIEEHGSPSNGWDDPGSSTIVGITEAYRADNSLTVRLTDAERERIEREIGEAIDTNPADFYGDDE